MLKLSPKTFGSFYEVNILREVQKVNILQEVHKKSNKSPNFSDISK